MYLLYAPPEKFGLVPSGIGLISPDIKFYMNVAFCPTFYWKKVHVDNGCQDISPKVFRKIRKKRPFVMIAVFAKGGIGDCLWAMPLVRAIAEKNPKAKIAIITEPKRKPIWDYCPFISAVVQDAYWNIVGITSKCDEVYDFGGVATIYKKFMKYDPIEASFKMIGLPVPKDKEKCRPKITLSVDEGKRAEAFLKSKKVDTKTDTIISIGLRASTNNRHWPFEYVQDLSKALIADGHKVIWLGDEPRFSEENIKPLDIVDGVINLVNQTDLRQAMTVISLSDLYIGPNSGLMVIATSLMTPTIGLFGAFDPKIRSKYYERFSGLWKRISCAPCNEHWTECRKGHPAPCMKELLPSDVYKEAVEMLKKYPRSLLEKLPMR